jgi:WWE domain
MGRVAGIVLPLFLLMLCGFLAYRRRKILASRKQKQIIAEKEAELEAFRDSIVGICVAVREYVPQAVAAPELKRALSKTKKLRVSYSKDKEKGKRMVTCWTRLWTREVVCTESLISREGVWCWKETSHMMSNHDPASVFGDPKDCWIKYDKKSTDLLEQAHQSGATQCHPLDGYTVDFSTMLQTKQATGFQRKVQRIVHAKPAEDIKDLDLSEAHFSDGLPAELAGEPQVVLIKDDLIQISKKRDDGWCFGTKVSNL